MNDDDLDETNNVDLPLSVLVGHLHVRVIREKQHQSYLRTSSSWHIFQRSKGKSEIGYAVLMMPR